jgi:hypothetical protein
MPNEILTDPSSVRDARTGTVSAYSPGPSATPNRLLIVDPDAEQYVGVLRSRYTPFAAHTCAEAVRRLAEVQPSVIVTELTWRTAMVSKSAMLRGYSRSLPSW